MNSPAQIEPFFQHRDAFFSLIEDDHVCLNMIEERFESRELDFMLSFLGPGDTFWDVGANFGLFTVLAAKRVGIWGSVIAFEPSPLNYHRLKANLWKNRLFLVKTRRLALGKESRKSVVFHESTQGAYSGLHVGQIPGVTTKIRVKETTLDSFARWKFRRVTLLKMDVEGGEWDVIKGGNRFFRRPGRPVVLAELDDERTLPAGYSAHEIYRALGDLGYHWFSLEPGLKLKAQEICREYHYVNLVGCPKESLPILSNYMIK